MDGELMSAENTTKSLSVPEAKQCPRSALAVVVASLTKDETQLSEQSEQDIVLCLLAMIEGMQREMLSRDSWELSLHNAVDRLKEWGVPDETIRRVYTVLGKRWATLRNRSPLSCLF